MAKPSKHAAAAARNQRNTYLALFIEAALIVLI
jgi:hypothetical protein